MGMRAALARMVSHKRMSAELDPEVASAFESIPEIESIYIIHGGTVLKVFIFVNEEDDSVYNRIYDREIDLEKRLSDQCFDFRVIARRNRPIQEFVGSMAPVWERSAEACAAHQLG
jgi:hypothetical protein